MIFKNYSKENKDYLFSPMDEFRTDSGIIINVM